MFESVLVVEAYLATEKIQLVHTGRQNSKHGMLCYVCLHLTCFSIQPKASIARLPTPPVRTVPYPNAS